MQGADYYIAHYGRLTQGYRAVIYADERLPRALGRIWYRAEGGAADGGQIVYSSDGLIFVSYDGFKSFAEVVPGFGARRPRAAGASDRDRAQELMEEMLNRQREYTDNRTVNQNSGAGGINFDELLRNAISGISTNIIFNKPLIDTNIIRRIISNQHWEHNRLLRFSWEHITNQYEGKATEVKMGFAPFGSNACGWVAAFNAFLEIDRRIPVQNIVQYIENNNGLILDGAFGVNPAVYGKMFKDYGVNSTTIFINNDLDAQAQEGRTAILCYFNSNNIRDGAHYITITWDPETEEYIAYNVSSREPVIKFDSIDDFLKDKGEFIALIVIE